jgi:hypothetical protein
MQLILPVLQLTTIAKVGSRPFLGAGVASYISTVLLLGSIPS